MMLIGHELIEATCKNTIETILLCLKHAVKGTIYAIGPVPDLTAVRITSGVRDSDNGHISWGLPQTSDYNYPGKTWVQYRDNPGHPLEAMGWCVERQKSWTADNPYENIRSVRKQLQGEIEDTHHMEPVLVKKADLYGEHAENLHYPLDWQGNAIWQNSHYVVVAVIKIHFMPHSIQQGDTSTKIIKKLSSTLGTELLSLHLRESYLKAQARLSQQRLESANVLAHELRNSLTKLGFVFSAINGLMGFLRDEWEMAVQSKFPHVETKARVLESLDEELTQFIKEYSEEIPELSPLMQELEQAQVDLAELPLLPGQAQRWISDRIEPRWKQLLASGIPPEELEKSVTSLLDRLVASVWVVIDENLIDQMDHLPPEIRHRWPQLAYSYLSIADMNLLNETIKLLDEPRFKISRKHLLKKILTSLKVIVDVISKVEIQANRIIYSIKSGNDL